MSLISIKNFLAPISNKVHLITIIVVAVVFAVLRLQGGGISLKTDFEKPALHQNKKQERYKEKRSVFEEFQKDQAATEAQREKKKAYGARSHAPAKRNSVLDELIGSRVAEKKAQAQKARKPVQAPDKTRDQGLADIEKSLGLR